MKRKFDVKLRKVGNSFVVTIPRDIVDRFELEEGDYLALSFNSEEIKRADSDKKEEEKKNSDKKGSGGKK